MTWVARVLYENKRSDDKAYALHQLVCAMVDDGLGITVRRLRGTGSPVCPGAAVTTCSATAVTESTIRLQA